MSSMEKDVGERGFLLLHVQRPLASRRSDHISILWFKISDKFIVEENKFWRLDSTLAWLERLKLIDSIHISGAFAFLDRQVDFLANLVNLIT